MVYQEILRTDVDKSDNFSLQLDENTNITNKFILLYYIKYEYENIIPEDIIFVTL